MKKSLTLAAVLLCLSAQNIFAQSASSGVGLGIVLGDPTGIAAKFWMDRDNAVDAVLGFGSENFHVDYLWHKYNVFRVQRGRLPLYYGIGGAGHFGDDPSIGVRVPIGITYMFPRDPVDIFFEIAPAIFLVSKAELDLTAGIGVRFFFQ